MTKKLTRSEAAELLRRFDNYVLLSHRRPDGDTTGSTAALCRGLRALGKRCHILTNGEVTDKFRWLHEGLTRDTVEEGDVLISVDVASPQMLPEAFLPYLDRITLRIDHHGAATSFTQYEVVDPDSASCAEVVWDILSLMGCPHEEAILEGIYVGLSTDTGCFRYSNTTAHTFATAAVCAQAGVCIYLRNQELFETNTLARLKMQGWIVDHMKLLRRGTMAVIAIPKAVEEGMGVTSDDMDNISSFPRTVSGVRIAATLREGNDGTCKLSVRAVPGYDATAVTVPFGGGGHMGAAGGTIGLPLDQAAKAVEEILLALPE